MEEFERRFRGRGIESEDVVLKCFENVCNEMVKKDVEGFFDVVIVNDDVDKAYEVLKFVIVVYVEIGAFFVFFCDVVLKYGFFVFVIVCVIVIVVRVFINKGGF